VDSSEISTCRYRSDRKSFGVRVPARTIPTVSMTRTRQMVPAKMITIRSAVGRLDLDTGGPLMGWLVGIGIVVGAAVVVAVAAERYASWYQRGGGS
jgi:hypothetical protein